VAGFLGPLPVGTIPGIGKKTEKELAERGICTIRQLAETDVQTLQSHFGRWGIYMHRLAHGQDTVSLRPEKESRSIGRETTFETDTDRVSVLEEALEALSANVHRSLAEEGYAFRTVTLKVRDDRFVTHTRSRTLDHLSTDGAAIRGISRELLDEFLDGRKIRLLGVRLSHLYRDHTLQASIQEFL
jgi:DNA polymerase IV (DinB-like DNA polymerase)